MSHNYESESMTHSQIEGGNTELFEEEIMVPFEIWVTLETGG